MAGGGVNETERLLMALALVLDEKYPEKAKALRKIAMAK
jgi:hypothetical protein